MAFESRRQPRKTLVTAPALTQDEGEALILAFRSGTSLGDLSERLGVSRQLLYQRLGVWALRHAALRTDQAGAA